MHILVSIDDTDNLDSRGTGELASLIARDIEVNGWGTCRFVTRHQLLVHPDIPYTSHNSAMCFAADIGDSALYSVIDHASAFLAAESAEGSDPGLCVVAVEQLNNPEDLILFGKNAKLSVLTKESAYDLARRTGVHLSEHGGSGQGIIGALAGAGLRLSGNDGRLKGRIRIDSPDDVISVAALRGRHDIDAVRTPDGMHVPDPDLVRLGDKVKTVLLDGKAVLLVVPTAGEADGIPWQTCSKQQLRKY